MTKILYPTKLTFTAQGIVKDAPVFRCREDGSYWLHFKNTSGSSAGIVRPLMQEGEFAKGIKNVGVYIGIAILILLTGCGDEGIVNTVLPPPEAYEAVAASPMWTPDSITMRELIFPYAAKQCIGIHDIRGDVFRLASCEVLYKSRRVRYSERDNRWVRLSTGFHPPHATHWTHGGVSQSIYFFLNFDNEADYQQFGVGNPHENVIFSVVNAFSTGKNEWQVSLKYRSSLGSRELDTPLVDTPIETVDRFEKSTPVLVAGNRHVASISLTRLGNLTIREGNALNGTEKVISTTFGILEFGRGWVRIPSGRTDLQIFISAVENAFDPNTVYAYVHVSIERVVETHRGQYELWLTHIP